MITSRSFIRRPFAPFVANNNNDNNDNDDDEVYPIGDSNTLSN